MRNILYLLLFLCTYQIVSAQNSNLQVGSNLTERQYTNSGYYDLSDPVGINVKVSVWGSVRFPGKYVVPENTTINDLLSFAGGPTENANLEHLRVFKQQGADTTYSVTEFNYNDLLWENQIQSLKMPPKLAAGDILIVPTTDRLYFREYLTMGLSIVSTLVSITILIMNIVK